LANPHYAAYLRRRGRLCVQTGFSDAGRSMGQIAAAASVERLRLRLASLLAERGFADIEVVIFDTHGESIGRGGHPSSFADRLAYVASPASRAAFARAGIRLKEETSFQGGDGYVNFLTPPIAFTSLCRILEFTLEPPAEDAEADPFYAETDYVSEFFITIRQFNERLMADPQYAALLDAYGANMLYPSGSRALRREHDGTGSRVDLAHPWQIRAIPHNAILQQLGLLATVLGGVGQAVAKDPERFQLLYRQSPRFRRLFAMVEWALEFSDLDVLTAYVNTLDPGLWLLQAAHHGAGGRLDEFRQVAQNLEATEQHQRLLRILRLLQTDHLDLVMALAAARGAAPAAPLIDGIGGEARNNLHLLHALRVALIHRSFMLATHIPDFSDQHGINREQLMTRILHLEIEPAVQLLGLIFPKVEPLDLGDFGEPATYVSDANQSYEQEHDRIFQPLARLYELLRRVSAGVTHTIGAVG
jgi:phosphoenolpyruvate carboxylase